MRVTISVLLLIVLVWAWPVWRRRSHGTGSHWVSAQGLYSSHNFCISNAVDYRVELFVHQFSVQETIQLRPMENVYECFFYGEKFDVSLVSAFKGSVEANHMEEFDPVLQLLPSDMYSLRISNDMLWSNQEDYRVTFQAKKFFSKVGEGLTFKIYRDRTTFKRSWYAFVHMSPSQCGKAFFCTNNLKDLHTLRIQAVHWKSHNLYCAGATTTESYNEFKDRSVCENSFKVGVNNLHYSLSKFPKIEHITYDREGNKIHHITIVGPTDESGLINDKIVEHFGLILQIYSLLLMTVNLRHFHAIFYVLPNYNKEIPEVFSGSCYFKLEHLEFNIDLETTYRSYLKCLLHQGYMNERISDSWVLRYVPEGLFERMINTYMVLGVRDDYYLDVLLGDEDDLESLAKYEKRASDIKIRRPIRKAAGFWQMLHELNATYGERTYQEFEDNLKIVETHAEFVKWVTRHSEHLNLTPTKFLAMLYTWTAPRGYPILRVEVAANRTVCVRQRGARFYFRSRIVPFVLVYNYPRSNSSELLWTSVKGDNCHTAASNLYPYLINPGKSMIGRILYDPVNWLAWSTALMKRQMRDALPVMQRVTLIMDALYFAQENQLNWTMSIKFLLLIKDETDELAWRSFDRVLDYLDSLTRYTGIYTMFQRMVAEIVQKYFFSAEFPSAIAIKWYCMTLSMPCLRFAEQLTEKTLIDETFMPNSTEVLCGGMRRLPMERFRAMLRSMGMPDWREPMFYIEHMVCAQDPQILRELMHYLFFYHAWYFRSSLLKSLVLKMIRAGKTGSDAVFYYLDHNPQGMLKQLGEDNLMEVFQVLARYTRDSNWLTRFVKRLYLDRKWDDRYMKKFQALVQQIRKNKRWYNVHYEDFALYLIEGFQEQAHNYEV